MSAHLQLFVSPQATAVGQFLGDETVAEPLAWLEAVIKGFVYCSGKTSR